MTEAPLIVLLGALLLGAPDPEVASSEHPPLESFADLVEAMESDSGTKIESLRVDGGASANDLLLTIQANLLGIPVVRPQTIETTALGAAYLAGLAVGFWNSREEIATNLKVDRVFEPTLNEEEIEELRQGWRKAVKRCKAWETARD